MSNVSGSRFNLLGLAAAAALMGSQGSAVEVVRTGHGGPDLPPTPASSGRRAKRGKRLAPAIDGGNWQGAEYLTYREHDQLCRLTDARWTEGPTRVADGPMTRADALAFVRSQRAA